MHITEEQLKLITETASQTASQEAIKAWQKQELKKEKEKHDRRLRNMKLLLRNYRTFVKHCKDVEADIKGLKSKLDLDDLDTDEFKIQSIMRSKERTLAMVDYINQALKVYKVMCEESEDIEDQRRYQVIYGMYISKEKQTAKKLASGHSVHERTIYKDIDNACKTLSVLMFGVDAIKFK